VDGRLRDLDERFITDETLGLMFVSTGNCMLAYPVASRQGVLNKDQFDFFVLRLSEPGKISSNRKLPGRQ
jgi:hypothetical protein